MKGRHFGMSLANLLTRLDRIRAFFAALVTDKKKQKKSGTSFGCPEEKPTVCILLRRASFFFTSGAKDS